MVYGEVGGKYLEQKGEIYFIIYKQHILLLSSIMKTADNPSNISYLASPETNEAEVALQAQQKHLPSTYFLARRGYALGWIGSSTTPQRLSPEKEKQAWHHSEAVFWPGMLTEQLSGHASDLEHSYNLYLNVLEGASCVDVLEAASYHAELDAQFNLVSCSYDESDLQQVERLDFEPATVDSSDDLDLEVWMKASWLSHEEDDASMRFRFSFGLDGCEDVAADPYRQTLTSQLAQIIFPESRIITENAALANELKQLLEVDAVEFVERIVYFNSPDGGAQFHQDVERGHLGVIFAQMSGRTAWLALSKKQLLHEILTFLASEDARSILTDVLSKKYLTQLFRHANDPAYINAWLDQRDNDALDTFINQTPAFTQQLVDHGYAYVLHPGDVLLLPQQGMDDCAWHSVFCLDEEPGEALSFAMKQRDVI